jgi:hypothetical protein
MKMEKLTGQIITRPLGPLNVMANPLNGSKRVLVAIVGIVAVDSESPLNVEGRQLTVSSLMADDTVITVHTDGAIDRSKCAEGMPLGNLLMEPIWRV